MMYNSILSQHDTEYAIKLVKDTFQTMLSAELDLRRVTAPMIVMSDSGLNDNLNGEQPVKFITLDGTECQIVHSLAKWKRVKLGQMQDTNGIYTDMNAIRAEEYTDRLHSIYVDQWDWEALVPVGYRNKVFLFKTVRKIYNALLNTERIVCGRYPQLKPFLPKNIEMLSSEYMSIRYNDKKPITTKEEKDKAEYQACQDYGAIFVYEIGKITDFGQQYYDKRSPDYDDWELNGDIIVWDPVIEAPMELSSMGIRVNKWTLQRQLKALDKTDWLKYDYHQSIINETLPQTIGGGIGQSRLCMLLLHKAHIGEVQVSVWPKSKIETCKEQNIILLQ